MHRRNPASSGSSGGDIPTGAYHRMGSSPPASATSQGPPLSGITSPPEPHNPSQSPPGFSSPSHTHPLQQFLMGTQAALQGINIANLQG